MLAAKKAGQQQLQEKRGWAKQEAPRRKAPALLLVMLATLRGPEPHLQEVLEASAVPAVRQREAIPVNRLVRPEQLEQPELNHR